MKKPEVRFAPVVALALFACFLFVNLPASVQEQENLTQKTAPKPKTAPGQKAAPLQGSIGQFKIGEFTVIVDTGRPSGERGLATPNSRNTVAQPAVQTTEGLSGQGHILIKGHRVNVAFSGVKFAQSAPGQIPVATAGTVTGTPGPPVEYTLNAFKIRLERQTIRLTPSGATAAVGVSLVQAPFMATGTANTVTLASESCGFSPDGGIGGKNFRGSSSFELRDSIYRLRLDSQVDQSVLFGQHKPGPRPSTTPSEGILLTGIASTSDNIDVFNFNGAIGGDGTSARFDLSLIRTPYQTEPEPRYLLSLQSGGVNYTYGHDGVLNCAGEFVAQLTLPETIRGEETGRIVLDNIVLKTDQTGALFNALTISARIRTGFSDANQPANQPVSSVFLIEPSPNSAFAYFAKWQAPRNSTYAVTITNQKTTTDCKALMDFLARAGSAGTRAGAVAPKSRVQRTAVLTSPAAKTAPPGTQSIVFRLNEKARERNVYERPGLTILQGTLYMKAPQASFPSGGGPDASAEFKLKTRFWGVLTATPWGMTGSLTSSACSFIPASPGLSLDQCTAPSGTSQPTWEQILKDQDGNPKGQPQHKLERFRLAELRILEMRVAKLRLCMNAMPEKGAAMTSIVHFPFPSYIDVDFLDESLDSQGRFHTALGPIAPVVRPASASPNPISGQDDPSPGPDESSGISHGPSLTPAESPLPPANPQTHIGPMVKAKTPFEIPQTRILWAWRLPITLTGRGVTINFPQGGGPASVQVVMNSTADDSGNITSSEIWLKPLFSKKSTVKEGVRIEAMLAATGEFRLTRWDPDPVLCRTYPSPGTIANNELKMGFACHLEGITLADAGPTFNTDRDRDFGWTGRITFPLFGEKPVTFGVKKLGPFMPQAIAMEKSDSPYQTCPDDSKILTLNVRDMGFSRINGHFFSNSVTYKFPKSADAAEHQAISLDISSFLSALVLKGAEKIPWLDLTEKIAPGQTLTVHGLKDASYGKDFIDLDCYDAAALALQTALGLQSGCCTDNYWVGTYQVKQRDKVIVSASNAKYYEGYTPATLFLNGSSMQLTPEGDSGAGGNRNILDIPGAELKMENGALYGDFDTASLPAFLPNVRGECTFTLDARNAYFSLMIGGSFPITPFPVNVEGVTFFFHAPRNQLDRIFARAAEWALYADVDSMKKAMGMSDGGISDSTVMSGALLSGNAAVVADFGPVEARIQRGAGLFFFQYKNEGGATGYHYGVFQNNRGVADVEFLTAEVVIDLTLAAQSTQGSFDSVRSYFQRSDLAFTGTISASACATCELAYARLDMKLDATYSVRGGLSWSGISPTASVGLGGCH